MHRYGFSLALLSVFIISIFISGCGEKWKEYNYEDSFAAYHAKYPDWRICPVVTEFNEIVKSLKNGRDVAEAKYWSIFSGPHAWEFRKRLDAEDYMWEHEETFMWMREDVMKGTGVWVTKQGEATISIIIGLYWNIPSLAKALSEVPRQHVLEQEIIESSQISVDEIEAVINRNDRNFKRFAPELDASLIHILAKSFTLVESETYYGVAFMAVESKWEGYKRIARDVVNSAEINVIPGGKLPPSRTRKGTEIKVEEAIEGLPMRKSNEAQIQ